MKHGDSLSGIAAHQLGSVFAYSRLFDANRHVIGHDPNLIKTGMVLTVPCETSHLEDLDWSVMPSPEQISQLMDLTDVQVIDIRAPRELAEGTVPGAIWSPYNMWSGPEGNPGGVPDDAALSHAVSALGLSLDQPIVIFHHKDNPMATGRAARVYWLLKSVGAEQLAILRGGFRAWEAADLPVAAATQTPRRQQVNVSMSDEWYADEIEVFGVITEQLPGSLLDARPHGIFERFDNLGRALASTLPGSSNAPVPSLLQSLQGDIDIVDGAERVIAHLREQEVAFGEGAPVISFCHTGELAALNWFYASELAALPGMKLYPDSTKGWTSIGGVLVPGGEGIPEFILNDVETVAGTDHTPLAVGASGGG